MTWRGPVEIIPAGYGQIDELTDMIRADAAEGSYAHLTFDPATVRESLTNYIDDEHRTLLSAVDGQSTIGFIAGHMEKSLIGPDLIAGEVAFYVRPEKRGGRTATLLIREFCRWAVRNGARRIVFGNAAGMNDRAYTRLFKRYGFKQMGSIMVMEV